MLTRTYDASKIEEALKMYPFEPIDLDVQTWVEDHDNIALEAEDGSIGLFEWFQPKSYDGHYFFKARGKDAIDLANLMLEEVHTNYGAKVIRGFTPTKHKAALRITRHLGFTDLGEVPTEIGPCVLFYMNLDERFKSVTNATNKGTQE